MDIEASQSALTALWHMLAMKQVRPADPARIEAHVRKIADFGAAALWDVENLLSDYGMPWSYYQPLQVLETLGAPLQPIFIPPKRPQQRVGAGQHVAVNDLALGLVTLERLGFAIDPTPMVDAVWPVIAEKKRQKMGWTHTELHLYYFRCARHCLEPVTLKVSDKKSHYGLEEMKLPTGYKVEFDRSGDRILSLRVAAPRYRKPRMAA